MSKVTLAIVVLAGQHAFGSKHFAEERYAVSDNWAVSLVRQGVARPHPDTDVEARRWSKLLGRAVTLAEVRAADQTEQDRRAREAAAAAVARLSDAAAGAGEGRTYQNQFGDFDLGDIEIPEGWEDDSWGNDVCPSWRAGDLKIWIDYAEPSLREMGSGSPRFIVDRFIDANLEELADRPLLTTDDWTEVLAFVEQRNKDTRGPVYDDAGFLSYRISRDDD